MVAKKKATHVPGNISSGLKDFSFSDYMATSLTRLELARIEKMDDPYARLGIVTHDCEIYTSACYELGANVWDGWWEVRATWHLVHSRTDCPCL